jgi:hypothetical protein
LVPSFLYAFHDTGNQVLAGLVLPERVPAPPSLVLLAAAGGLLLARAGRRRQA